MTHTDYQEMLAAYALDAIDPVDRQALDEHLAGCGQCRGELKELADTTALLTHVAPTEAPGDHVRAEILARVRAESAGEHSQKDSARVLQMPARTAVWPTFLRLAAAIAFVALLLTVFVLWRRDARMRADMDRLARQLESQQSEAQRDRDLLARQQEALTLLNSEATTRIQLTGMAPAPNARATLVFDKRTGRAVLMTDGLPSTSADMAYEVWFIPKGKEPMPGKVFTVDSSGHAMISEQLPPEALAGALIAITVEPKSGSRSPTGPMYLSSPAS